MTHPGELLKRNSLYAGKELGQNFLSNPATAQMIVDYTGICGETRVLEVGPGLGALTLPLARAAATVTAVEKDRRIIPLLESEIEQAGVSNVTLINADILKTDIRAIAGKDKLVVMGNLPYNISSQILFKLVKTRTVVDRAFLMFQKELAERLVAVPGNKVYGRITAMLRRMLADIEREVEYTSSLIGKRALDPRVMRAMEEVPREAFVPASMLHLAFENGPLPIGYGQTISQPYIVALMSDLLQTQGDHVVLEIGTGSGYQTAILSRMEWKRRGALPMCVGAAHTVMSAGSVGRASTMAARVALSMLFSSRSVRRARRCSSVMPGSSHTGWKS